MEIKNLKKKVEETPNDFKLGQEIREMILESEDIDYKELYLRSMADNENLKKRFIKEKEELVLRTKTSLLDPILDIDNEISMALEHDKDNVGIKLIVSKLDKFLKSQNIEIIQTDNYDSDLHEVISVVNLEDKGIVKVASKGYSIDNKIIRYPKVILSE